MGFAILEGLDENGVRTMVRLHGSRVRACEGSSRNLSSQRACRRAVLDLSSAF